MRYFLTYICSIQTEKLTTKTTEMKTATDIFNETLGERALIGGSLYFEKNNRVVRFSDHAANHNNFLINNEEAEEVLLVFVNTGMTENEMQSNNDEIYEKLTNISECNYLVFDENSTDDNDIDYITKKVEKFLNK